MQVIDQNSATLSWQDALVPGPAMIDGRSEQDLLAFLANFASLINFYEMDNTVKGNWRPFLLKDPAILLASISNTNFSTFHAFYADLRQLLNKELKKFKNKDLVTHKIVFYTNQLFDIIIKVFVVIEDWTKYLLLTTKKYELRAYVLSQVKHKFSIYFWAILDLKENMSLACKVKGIRQVHYSVFDGLDDLLWKESRNCKPFLETLDIVTDPNDIPHRINANTVADFNVFFTALTKKGDEVFTFFHAVIKLARIEFDKVKVQKCSFPDTLLLRAFTNTISVHQQQLNGLAQKHLKYYYSKILKQEPNFAIPDTAYVNFSTGIKNAAFNLPAGTQLQAGLDAHGNQIVFATNSEVIINPAKIKAVLNFSPAEDTGSPPGSILQKIVDPSIVKKDPAGKTLPWSVAATLATNNAPAPPKCCSIIIASPMFFLREGMRTITLTFSNENKQFPGNTTLYLSTADTWIKVLPAERIDVAPFIKPGKEAGAPLYSPITIIVPVGVAAIAPFSAGKNPDGIESKWPLLKIELPDYSYNVTQPIFTQLEVTVTASGLQQSQLYNEAGMPYASPSCMPFGPAPLAGSSFIFGNKEIFSKPVTELSIQIGWEALPPDFSSYYKQYNDYLNNPDQYPLPFVPPNHLHPHRHHHSIARLIINRMFALLKWVWQKVFDLIQLVLLIRFFKWIWRRLRKPKQPPKKEALLANIIALQGDEDTNAGDRPAWSFNSIFRANTSTNQKDDNADADPPVGPFNNTAFRAQFYMLENHAWESEGGMFTLMPPSPASDPHLLFTTISGDITQPSTSTFHFESVNGNFPFDPKQQLQQLPLLQQNTCGFMKIELAGIKYGFGSTLYPQVAANVSLWNAWVLQQVGPYEVNPPINLPWLTMPNQAFVPKIMSFAVNEYSATETYNFNDNIDEDAFQYFIITPLGTSPLSQPPLTPSANLQVNVPPLAAIAGKITLSLLPKYHPHEGYKSYLFFETAQLFAPAELNLYFEIIQVPEMKNDIKVDWLVLTSSGWTLLKVISDGTSNMRCTGVITMYIPENITAQPLMGEPVSFWLAAAAAETLNLMSRIVFVGVNGVQASRSGDSFFSECDIPYLPDSSITKPLQPIPQIAAISQPFPSFGGKGAETEIIMNQRVSTRLKTKDRAITNDDFYRIIKQEFSNVYYVKSWFDAKKSRTEILVLKTCSNENDPDAFCPKASESNLNIISKFLSEKVQLFSNYTVTNFRFIYVQVIAAISVADGYAFEKVKENVTSIVNIYLSPWVTSGQEQAIIDQLVWDTDPVKPGGNRMKLDAYLDKLNGDKGQLGTGLVNLHTVLANHSVNWAQLHSDIAILNAAQVQLNTDVARLNAYMAQLNTDRTGLDTFLAQLNADQVQLNAGMNKLNAALAIPGISLDKLNAALDQMEADLTILHTDLAKLSAAYTRLNTDQAGLEAGLAKLIAGITGVSEVSNTWLNYINFHKRHSDNEQPYLAIPFMNHYIYQTPDGNK